MFPARWAPNECLPRPRGVLKHSTASRRRRDAGFVERHELVDKAREIDQIKLGDTLDLPADEVALTIATLVLGRTFQKKMVGVHVDLDGPSQIRYGEIDADIGAVRKPQARGLRYYGNCACPQGIAEHDLRMRLSRWAIATLDKAPNEPKRSTAARVTQTSSDGGKFIHRAVTFSNQLLHDGRMVLNTEDCGKIKGQSRRAGSRDAVASMVYIRGPDRGGLVKSNVELSIEMNAMGHREVNRLGVGHSP